LRRGSPIFWRENFKIGAKNTGFFLAGKFQNWRQKYRISGGKISTLAPKNTGFLAGKFQKWRFFKKATRVLESNLGSLVFLLIFSRHSAAEPQRLLNGRCPISVL
jgi:hypothetical protein